MRLRCIDQTCKSGNKSFDNPDIDTGKVKLTSAKCPACGKTNLREAAKYNHKGERIEPDFVHDNLKLCIYYSFAATFHDHPDKTQRRHNMEALVAETKPLRETYPVAFDEDEWIPVLAEYYGFGSVKSVGVAYDDVLTTCQALHTKAKKDNTHYVVIALAPAPTPAPAASGPKKKQSAAKQGEQSGHAICVKCKTIPKKGSTPASVSVEVVDNETDEKTKLRDKFKNQKFNIYMQQDMPGSISKKTAGEKEGAITEANLAPLRTLAEKAA